MIGGTTLVGKRVSGKYLGVYEVTGTVVLSRVGYTGSMTHHVILDKPITIHGLHRDLVILEADKIESLLQIG